MMGQRQARCLQPLQAQQQRGKQYVGLAKQAGVVLWCPETRTPLKLSQLSVFCTPDSKGRIQNMKESEACKTESDGNNT